MFCKMSYIPVLNNEMLRALFIVIMMYECLGMHEWMNGFLVSTELKHGVQNLGSL